MKNSTKAISLVSGLVFLVALFFVGQALKPLFFKADKKENKINNVQGKKIENKVSFLFVGDVMLDRHVGELIKKNGFDYLFARMPENNKFFTGYDIISANLEGAVTNGGAHYPPLAGIDFSFSPELVANLKKYNFNFFTLANNHITDQGSKGYTETLANLKKLDLNYSGAGDALVNENSITTKEVNGVKIAFISFSMVYKNFDLAKAEKLIKEAKVKNDLVLINIHWGTEYKPKFNQGQQKIGHAFIEAGADLIIGHHPHVFEGMEIYKNKAIFYSLGNFIFDQYWSVETQRSLAVGAVYEKGQWQFNLFGLEAKASQPFLVENEAKAKFLANFSSRSELNKDYLEQVSKGSVFIQ